MMPRKTEKAAQQTSLSYKSWPFYWLARAGGRYRESMEALLRPSGIDMPRWRVLMTLHHDRVAGVSEIAAHSSEKLPTMTRIIQRMESDGLVRRQARPGKEWIMDVALTPDGEEAGRAAWEKAATLYARAFREMSQDDIDILNKLLNKIAENLHATDE